MAAQVVQPALVIMPAIVSGLIIGIYEILLIHRDVTIPTHRFGHGLQAVFVAIVAAIAVFNVPFVFNLFPQLAAIPYLGTVLGFRILIGIIMMGKIHGVSAALKGAGMASHGMRETWMHSLVVAALVILSPYIWPFVAPFLPSWAGGGNATSVRK
jgi:hypothetical protein